jgi:transcriptional regulator of arginine metabolism
MKQRRQVAILNLVSRGGGLRGRGLHTQQELTDELAKMGLETTQATVSRDIQELGLIRTKSGYKPALFTDYVTSVETVQFLTVVKTSVGCANLVARALDERELPGVTGTLAGDDTIIVVHPDAAAAKAFHHFLNG